MTPPKRRKKKEISPDGGKEEIGLANSTDSAELDIFLAPVYS